jgi:1,4-dihydroxy-6-naphthoate synthase
MTTRAVSLAHSPDPDDAFMFYAITAGKVASDVYKFVHELSDIETLNRRAMEGAYDVTAVSFHAYAYLWERYALLPHGASVGDGYGPIVVSARPLDPDDLASVRVAVPGTLTTAFLALRLFRSSGEYSVLPFDKILPAVLDGSVEAGLIIHEGQLTYATRGLHKVVDLGEWWMKETGLPLPLGGNVMRKDLGPAMMRDVSRLLRQSIAYAREHRDEALAYAMKYGRGIATPVADRFVSMYVNDYTLELGPKGKDALVKLYARAHEAGVIPKPVTVEVFDDG